MDELLSAENHTKRELLLFNDEKSFVPLTTSVLELWGFQHGSESV